MTKIGVTLPQFTDDAKRFISGVRDAEAMGFESVWLFDHLWPLGGKRERPILECWTALAYVAAATDARKEAGETTQGEELARLTAQIERLQDQLAPGPMEPGSGQTGNKPRGEPV